MTVDELLFSISLGNIPTLYNFLVTCHSLLSSSNKHNIASITLEPDVVD